MARLARVVVPGVARHVAQRDRKSACEYDDAGNRLSVIDGSGTTPYVANALNQYTSANGTYYQYDTSGNMIYDGHYVFDYDPENRLNKVKRFEQGPTAMALACDTTLTFTSGGDAQWFSQTQEHYFEGDAAQSGDIGDSQYSSMEATVSGTGYISFYWKVSTDGSGDYLRFYIDDQLKEEHGGVAGWNQSTKYYVSTGGPHTLKWVYIKNSTGSGGSDCAWVDKILWEVPVPVGVDKGVDSLLAYTSGGNSTWSWTPDDGYGNDSAQSGYVSDEEETWMQTTVEGPGTFKFWWKVSSDSGYDELEFYIDTQLQDAISGTTSWAEKSYNITGAGAHTLKWRYVKDSGNYSGEDCGWVDHVQWSEPIAEPPTNAWSTLTYTYDASGRRIEKRYDDTLVLKYVYDGDHCIAEYDFANNLRRKYIFGPAIDQPICMIENSTTNYYHFDALGSTIALTDASGDAVQVYEYDVYGRVGATDPDHTNRFMFTGREFDKETGLYYYRARYYNPQIGRFLQTDLVGYGAGMNLYRYCLNNPLNWGDPSGLDPVDYYIYMSVKDPNGFRKLYLNLLDEKPLLEAKIEMLKRRIARINGELDRIRHALSKLGGDYINSHAQFSQWWLVQNILEGGAHIHHAVPPGTIPDEWPTPWGPVVVPVEEILMALAGGNAVLKNEVDEQVDYWKETLEFIAGQMDKLAAKRKSLDEQRVTAYSELDRAKERLKDVKAQLAWMQEVIDACGWP